MNFFAERRTLFPNMKKRLAQLVVERGWSESRQAAQRLIRAGLVRVDEQVQTKPGHTFPEDVPLSVTAPPRFVSRGGDKLEAAFEAFHLQTEGRICADIGSSTGGFTDCMLKHGAAKVYAVDVGKGQLHWDLRNDPRVVVMESTNARHLEADTFNPRPTFATVDVSFISLEKILPALVKILEPGSQLVTLIKPQFEAGREQVGKGGVVRDESVRLEVINRIKLFGTNELGLRWIDSVISPLKGPAGNTEYLAYWETPVV